ncbi:MAG: chromosomal replication initiator protein DnaA [Bacteroidales bacterium]|jgi:chromosomal replication initiator protein|nr:chromosomal replication initiator protein DnaA [Bacteroidales bacterium]
MEQNYQEVWKKCLAFIRDNLQNNSAFATWFLPIKPIQLKDDTLIIQVPTNYFYHWLEDNYVDLLRSAIRKELGAKGRLEYIITIDTTEPYGVTATGYNKRETKNPEITFPVPDKTPFNPFVIPGIRRVRVNSQLNEKLSFDNFVGGNCNQIARAAGFAVANDPGKTAYNPLFVYGKTGLGKTHLLNAIGLQSKIKNPDLTVLYISADQFTQQYIDASKNNSANEFTSFYQAIDALLIDDIHKLSGRPGTQDVFFNIFNTIHQQGKQIVLSSDLSPVDLIGIEPRLLSRFKWGLGAELETPDVETRIAILNKKIHENGLEISDEIVEYIAYSVSTSVRELEGVLISLLAQSILNKKDITMEFVKQTVEKIVRNAVRDISIDFIMKTVSDYFSIPIDEINAKTRRREIVEARQLAMYFSKKHTKASLSSIGQQCGNKDHATVLYACKMVGNLIATDKRFKEVVDDLSKKITG